MDATHLIPRRLDADSCITVGTQLASAVQAYKDSGKTLPDVLDKAAQQVTQEGQSLDNLGVDDTNMVAIDRATDRCVLGWEHLHDAIREVLSGEEELPLSQDETKLKALSEKL